MAKKGGSELSGIMSLIKDAINDSLKNEVADKVKETITSHAISDVYSYLTSGYYNRRMSLADESKIRIENGDMSLTATPISEFNPYLDGVGESNGLSNNSGDQLAVLIEYGEGAGGYNYDYASVGARPYIQESAEELESTIAPILERAIQSRIN